MNIDRIDLGAFNVCVEYLKAGQDACFVVDQETKVWYYAHEGTSVNDGIVVTEGAMNHISVPLVSVGAAGHRRRRGAGRIGHHLPADPLGKTTPHARQPRLVPG